MPGLRAVNETNTLLLSQEVEAEYREVIFRPIFDRLACFKARMVSFLLGASLPMLDLRKPSTKEGVFKLPAGSGRGHILAQKVIPFQQLQGSLHRGTG